MLQINDIRNLILKLMLFRVCETPRDEEVKSLSLRHNELNLILKQLSPSWHRP